MRGRVLFALGLVVIVSALLVVRHYGYLGGRQVGGPLRLGVGGDLTAPVKPGQILAVGLFGKLDGGPVRVQNVRARVLSPELEFLGPNRYAGDCGGCGVAHWPPPGASGPLEDATLSGERTDAIIGLRAQRAGVYYAIDLSVDYRRGQRRFRDREDQVLCISVRMGGNRCSSHYRGPGDARVAQVGGPQRYPEARLTVARAHYDQPGEYRLAVTLSNRTRTTINVEHIALDDNPLGVQVTETAPVDFHLPPHGYQVVKLRVRFPACQEAGTIVQFGRLRADLDGERRSMPLSRELEFECPVAG